jgi:hypothetical protein
MGRLKYINVVALFYPMHSLLTKTIFLLPCRSA